MNAGISTSVGTSARVLGGFAWARPMNSEMSCTRVWRNMNSRSGSSARAIAVAVLIWCAVSGSIASRLIWLTRGGHHEDRQEQRDPHQHLVGGRVGGAHRGADEAQHDQDAAEARHGEQQRRHQRQPAHQQQDLHGAWRSSRRSPAHRPFAQTLQQAAAPWPGIWIGPPCHAARAALHRRAARTVHRTRIPASRACCSV